jgi:retron-type reverse transcriptase
MKRIGFLYEKICSIENLQFAYENAKRNKKHYKQVQEFEKENIEQKLLELQQLLTNKQYKTSQYRTFNIIERGKERTIYSLPFYPDRITHHAIVQVLAPIWIKSFIRDTYASIPNRGIHDAVKRIQKVKHNWKNHYVLKCDISKFYPSVNHQVLKNIIKSKIKDKQLLALLEEIIDSGEGIPIGNYLSQYFGNIILSPLDHYVKEVLKVKYYYRYCDDFILIHPNKKHLHYLKNKINEYVKTLNLELKPNWQVYPIESRGLDFVGYIFYVSHTIIRKNNTQRYKERIKYKKYNLISNLIILNHIKCFKGWKKYANTRNLNNTIETPRYFNVQSYFSQLRRRLSRDTKVS